MRLIQSMANEQIRQGATADLTNPASPFAYAFIEFGDALHPANSTRAAWLSDYGMKHLPAETNSRELRLAAKLVPKVAEGVPEHKTSALILLDRARAKEPKDEETKALRNSLE